MQLTIAYRLRWLVLVFCAVLVAAGVYLVISGRMDGWALLATGAFGVLYQVAINYTYRNSKVDPGNTI
ncbi:hypothetical protein HNR11_002769 [Nesterenkonia sandarakina]|uniref:Uncharacterized protein n=1 Tax=Nesterenkonia sandarakina TaxID=272918 RepID=A0A7Z0EBX6_9MICC|nr:hypothetical protein [Nesterenkonia sandarakina]